MFRRRSDMNVCQLRSFHKDITLSQEILTNSFSRQRTALAQEIKKKVSNTRPANETIRFPVSGVCVTSLFTPYIVNSRSAKFSNYEKYIYFV